MSSLGAIPVSVRNVAFKGPVRVIVTHLMREAPGYGALLVSLPAPPTIGLDVRVAGGEVTRVPWFRDELERALQQAIADKMHWPQLRTSHTLHTLHTLHMLNALNALHALHTLHALRALHI